MERNGSRPDAAGTEENGQTRSRVGDFTLITAQAAEATMVSDVSRSFKV